MRNALLLQTHPLSGNPSPPLPSHPLLPELTHGQRIKTSGHLTEALPAATFNISPGVEAEIMVDAPGLFMGLRVALLFNAFLGLAGVVVYETWVVLAH